MPIICVAGADAVGKSTICSELQDTYGAWVVPDVGTGQNHIAEKQLERWQLALKGENDYPLIVLDGDIFQPLVRAWCTDDDAHLTQLLNIYHDAFLENRCGYPDKFFFLYAGERTMKQRRHKSRHWRIYTTKKETEINQHVHTYYNKTKNSMPGKIKTLAAYNEEDSARRIVSALPTGPWHRYDMTVFQRIKESLLQTRKIRV